MMVIIVVRRCKASARDGEGNPTHRGTDRKRVQRRNEYIPLCIQICLDRAEYQNLQLLVYVSGMMMMKLPG
jgi:hypothetical protein